MKHGDTFLARKRYKPHKNHPHGANLFVVQEVHRQFIVAAGVGNNGCEVICSLYKHDWKFQVVSEKDIPKAREILKRTADMYKRNIDRVYKGLIYDTL